MKENNWSIEDEGLPPDNDPMWSALASEAVKDNRTVDRPEDPCIQQESERHELVSDAAMEKLKTAINDFVKREYDIEPTEEFFDNPAYIGIAETSVEGRDDIVIDMAVNLDELTLDQYINGEKMDSWYYADIHSLISEINHISFDELVSLGPNAAQRVNQLMSQFPDEHDFIRNPEDGFAIYQLRADPANHILRFSSMSELRHEAQQLRREVHRVVENSEDILFDSRAAVEKYLRDEGFTVLPESEPAVIMVQSAARMKSTFYLTYGKDCCRIDGCDTWAADLMVQKAHYAQVYSGPMPDVCLLMKNVEDILESLFTKFNTDRPADFLGHSLSVSDVIVLKQAGQINCYYTDSFGFEKLPDFLFVDNPLRNAEMYLEDDYGMIDGLINNDLREERKPLRRMDAQSMGKVKSHHKDEPER